MNWGSASEFFAMGGHALFVWGSYGAMLLALVAEPLLLRRRHRLALQTVAEQLDEPDGEAVDAPMAESMNAMPEARTS
jgi:heme exporter protein D